MSIQTWLRQPTTITGIASLLGVAAGVAGHVLTGDMTAAAAAGAIAFAGTHMLVDDNTKAAAVQTLVTDGVNAAISGHLRDRLPTLLKDAVAVATTQAANPAVVVAQQSPPGPDAQSGGAIARVLGGLMLVASLGLLTACGGMTDAQKAAADQSAADVLVCLGQIAVPVDAEAQSGDSNATKAARAAEIAAAAKACRDAVQDGAQALPGAAPTPTSSSPAQTPAPATAPAVPADAANKVG